MLLTYASPALTLARGYFLTNWNFLRIYQKPLFVIVILNTLSLFPSVCVRISVTDLPVVFGFYESRGRPRS